jgi:equilibrative nucleoside transporter 1/2/3
MGGIFPALVSIFVTALNVDGRQLGFVCFLTATLALVASFLSFSWIRRKPFFRHCSAPRAFASTSDFLVHDAEARDPLIVIFKRSWIYCISISMLFTVTIAIFPAILVLVESQSRASDWGNTYFTLVTCFLLFNVGDYVGRSLACIDAIRPSSKALVLLLSSLRVGFVPIFLYCNAAPEHRPDSMPVLVESDSAYIAFVTAFAISNGFLANVCMILGPKTSSSSASQEATGMILVACLSVSCSLGSVLSYPLIGALGGA